MTSSNPSVTLLITWMGASPRHTRHYASLYHSLGTTCITVSPSPAQCHVRSLMHSKVRETLQILRRNDLLGRDCCMHAMSNNGGVFLSALYEYISTPEIAKSHGETAESLQSLSKWLNTRIKGICFESCPGVNATDPRARDALIQAMCIPTRQYSYFNPMLYLYILYNTLLSALYRIAFKSPFFSMFRDQNGPYYGNLRRMAQSLTQAKIHFIIADKDILVPKDQIKKFIKSCKLPEGRLGVHHFDADHVASLRADQKGYVKLVKEFLKDSGMSIQESK